MSASKTDLNALAAAVKPFEMALRPASQMGVSQHTRIGKFVNLAEMPISKVQALVDAVNAVRAESEK